ncbi:M28 family peptidase [Altererythrobacter sp. RZ02]|uniref:M28 family peptidase n=1 Tax=Pontixanthobacter rizhaonensis TaxID=2730337 RepID=A0A848QLJ1_9SPHN|nr:M28 family peptidase [Pontixanthobacter rizhaonensis]
MTVKTGIRLAVCLCALIGLGSCAGSDGLSRADANNLDRIESRLSAHIAVLASDEFEGRRPGSEGERKTLRYLADVWQAAGLQSATNDPAHPWFAPVELSLMTPQSQSVRIMRDGQSITIPETQVKLFTSGSRALVDDAPMVFVGKLGASLDRAELAGRIAVMIWDHNDRNDQRDALLENGAAGVLAIISDEAAFAELVHIRKNGAYRLAEESAGSVLDGVMSLDGAASMLGLARLNALLDTAKMPGFRPHPLDETASLEARSIPGTVRTHNLIAKLPGKKPDSGAVLLLAHWDHFGRCGDEATGDQICNGAVDNASGLSMLTEIAEQLGKGPRLDRDVYFLGTTAEEWGLLGARAFTRDPPIPLDTVVAAFNLDAVGIAKRGSPVAIVGEGLTPLDDEVKLIAAQMGRGLGNSQFAKQFVKRQDGWALLQADVPTLMVSSAFASPDPLRDYTKDRYHKPSDEMDEIELGGAAEDMLLHLELVRHFGSTASHPPVRP